MEDSSTFSADITHLRILIVDDEPMLRSVIQDFLEMIGVVNQFVAGDGLEALELLRREPLDCVLSDIRMPKMELEELLGIIQIEFPNLVVLATSGYSDMESARNIFSKGAHDFLGKPLNLDLLELALQWVVERAGILDRARMLLGQAACPIPPAEAEDRLGRLTAILNSENIHFKKNAKHCIRLSDLIKQLPMDLTAVERTDLRTAALLHELGIGIQVQSICRLPRRLDEDELRLIKEHPHVSGRLIARTLERPEFEQIIGQHLHWSTLPVTVDGKRSSVNELAVWLGVINSIDGCLQDRPDRPAHSTDQMFEMMTRRQQRQALPQLAQILEHWALVEQFYQHAG